MKVLCNTTVHDIKNETELHSQSVYQINGAAYFDEIKMLAFFISESSEALYMLDVEKDTATQHLRALATKDYLDLLNKAPLILGPDDFDVNMDTCEGDCDNCEFADICDEMGREDQAPFTGVIPINPKNGGTNKPVH